MKRLPIIRLAFVFLVLFCTVGCDQATKHFARSGLRHEESRKLADGFIELTLAENPGAFLSLGAALPGAVRGQIFTLAVGLGLAGLFIYLLTSSKLQHFSLFGFALIAAGGVSNLLDRLTQHGMVTDFMVLRAGPLHTGVFNVADMAIVAGIILVIWDRVREEWKHRHSVVGSSLNP